MIENLIFIIIILVFILASYEDIKKREVYDYLNFLLVFIILVFCIFDSIISSSFTPIKYVGFGLIVGYAIGAMFFYLGIWGGGDSKFLIGFCASIYYLKDFLNQTLALNNFYDFILSGLSYFFTFFIDTFLTFILFLDFIFMIGIIIMLFSSNLKKVNYKNLIYLLSIIFILFTGLYLNYASVYLILLGVLAFFLIFFAEDEVFESVYFKIKKRTRNLVEGDKVDSEIKINNKVIITQKDANAGLTKENIIFITNENIEKNNFVNIRKVLPYSILVGLNYLVYVVNIITLDSVNLSMLSLIFQFLFYSFIAGGIISIGLIFYFYFKNYNSLKIIFSKLEKVALYLIFAIILLVSISISLKLILVALLPFIYVLLKIAKRVEKIMFIQLKDLDKIVPGDWIAQDIIIDGKKIYTRENFKLGIEEEQIKRLKELAKEDKSLNKIYVKDGLAFLPALFIGFLLLLLL